MMPTLSEIREQYPDYKDMSDQQLSDALHSKFYSDIPREDFNKKIGFTPETSTSRVFGRAQQGQVDEFGRPLYDPKGKNEAITAASVPPLEAARGVPVVGALTPQTEAMTQAEKDEPFGVGLSRMTGAVAGSAPFFAAAGPGIIAGGLTGGALNAADSASRQLVDTGKIDPSEVGKSAAIGGATGVAGAVLPKIISPQGGKLVARGAKDVPGMEGHPEVYQTLREAATKKPFVGDAEEEATRAAAAALKSKYAYQLPPTLEALEKGSPTTAAAVKLAAMAPGASDLFSGGFWSATKAPLEAVLGREYVPKPAYSFLAKPINAYLRNQAVPSGKMSPIAAAVLNALSRKDDTPGTP